MKGTLNKVTRDRMYSAQERLRRAFKNRHISRHSWLWAQECLRDFKALKEDYISYMDNLPKRFGKNYGELEYLKDKTNVKLFYSKWSQEDWWEAKKSLKRLRRYEDREGLEPYEKKLEREKTIQRQERSHEREREYASKMLYGTKKII